MLFSANEQLDESIYQQSQQVFVVLGNCGLMLSGFMTLIGFVSMGAVMENMTYFGQATSVACLPLLYGVAIKLVCYVAQQKMSALAAQSKG